MSKRQSWAHRSYKLSERSKAMSDPWFSERKEKSVERWVNCQKKEFADRSKRSLSSKERAIFGGSLLSDVRKNEWTKDTHYWKQDAWPISILFPSGVRIWARGTHLAPIKSQPPTLHLLGVYEILPTQNLYVFFVSYIFRKCQQFCKIIFLETLVWIWNG